MAFLKVLSNILGNFATFAHLQFVGVVFRCLEPLMEEKRAIATCEHGLFL